MNLFYWKYLVGIIWWSIMLQLESVGSELKNVLQKLFISSYSSIKYAYYEFG